MHLCSGRVPSDSSAERGPSGEPFMWRWTIVVTACLILGAATVLDQRLVAHELAMVMNIESGTSRAYSVTFTDLPADIDVSALHVRTVVAQTFPSFDEFDVDP